MNSKLYKHKKTGRPYSLVQKEIKVKDITSFTSDGEFISEWIGGFVLYKAEYDNPDGPYFVRCAKDFYESFEEVKDETN